MKIIEDKEKEYEQKISKMRDDIFQIVNIKTSQYQKEISDIKNKNFLIPREIMENNKFLHEIIMYAMGNAPSTDFLNFCNLINILNHKTYSILRDFIPLIPERTLFTINSPEKSEINDYLSNPEKVPNALSEIYSEPLKKGKVHLTIGGDATTIKYIPEIGKTAAYTCMALPLDKSLKSIPINICQAKNGTSTKEIVDRIDELIKLIEKNGDFVVDFVATDGDVAFDKMHKKIFKAIEPLLEQDLTFIEKVEQLKELIHIPVSDFLHLLKNARSHLLNHLLMINPDT